MFPSVIHYCLDSQRWISRDPLGEEGGLNLYGYVLNNPVKFIDPLGLDNMNLLNPNAAPTSSDPNPRETWNDVNNTQLDPNYYTVAGHGWAGGMLDSNGNPISASKLADLIKKDPKYDPTKPVKLNACSTGGKTDDGSPNFAQQLAKALGNTVFAPTDILSREFNLNANFTWETPWMTDTPSVANGGTFKPFR